jgi:two-component system alkaline phosphatase synthesis response regulator PhoP
MSRVLVIDDETVVGTILRYAFAVDGHETVVAGDGVSGIEMAHSEHPDLIVLDLMMPDVTGYDVLEILRDDEETKELPIVVLTAVTMQRERDLCLSKGADAVMIKPFDPREVARAIGALLPPAASGSPAVSA